MISRDPERKERVNTLTISCKFDYWLTLGDKCKKTGQFSFCIVTGFHELHFHSLQGQRITWHLPEIAPSTQTTHISNHFTRNHASKTNKPTGKMAYLGPKIKWKKPKTYREDVIATAKASGCILQFWNSLLVGDELTLLSIVDDDEYSYLADAIYDTSNLEEWKNFRLNYRSLSRF